MNKTKTVEEILKAKHEMLAKNLRAIMEKEKISRSDIWKGCAITHTQIAAILSTGDCMLSTLYKLSLFLGYDTDLKNKK